ncbi:MAG TPA: hypothetical protein VKB77_01630 [Terriglobales bacterium]|nr:hypothetical protein [Terriglobales bacterium]
MILAMLLNRFSASCAIVLLGLFPASWAQSAAPTVTFSLSFPGSEPDRYSVAVPLNGDATYWSDGKLTESAEADDFKLTFAVTPATRARIFDLAKKAHYFAGEVDSKKKDLAFTGTKVLIYNDGQKESRASYNYSPVAAVQELTELFQDMSSTLEFGRRLEYYHRYQKLALDEELKRMEQMANENQLHELTAVAPVLHEIAEDNTVINPVRARAQRMLARASAEGR